MNANVTETVPSESAGQDPMACMLCGGRRWVSQFSGAPQLQAMPSERHVYRITHSHRALVGAILRCRGCGLVVLPPQYYESSDYSDAEDPYYVEQAPLRVANAHRLLDLVPTGGKLLEIGCACGFLLQAARERGFTASGVEMSAWASGYARDELGLDVTTGGIEDLASPADAYDVVVMADVIEHLSDPQTVVREILRILRPGGRLLLLTPDVGSVMARVAGKRWWGLLDDHYFYFSRATLDRFLRQEGFDVESIRAFGRRFPLQHWTFKLSQYSRGLQTATERVIRALHVDGLEISINLGDQMACVARKK